MLADQAGWHAGIVEAARLLTSSGALHTGADFGGGFGGRVVTQFLEGNRGHFHVDIDAVE
jgi:hypothetical protein